MSGPVSPRSSRVPRDVLAWRRRVLCRAGFDEQLALELAAEANIDLHRLLDLVDAGCPPALAARIPAP